MEWSHLPNDQEGSSSEGLDLGMKKGQDLGEWQGGERICSVKTGIRKAVGNDLRMNMVKEDRLVRLSGAL